jgi:hypothetical protein
LEINGGDDVDDEFEIIEQTRVMTTPLNRVMRKRKNPNCFILKCQKMEIKCTNFPQFKVWSFYCILQGKSMYNSNITQILQAVK